MLPSCLRLESEVTQQAGRGDEEQAGILQGQRETHVSSRGL